MTAPSQLLEDKLKGVLTLLQQGKPEDAEQFFRGIEVLLVGPLDATARERIRSVFEACTFELKNLQRTVAEELKQQGLSRRALWAYHHEDSS